MIGYHISPELGIVSSEGEVCNGDYLVWLLSDHTTEAGVFPDLDYAVASLLRLIGATREEGETLSKKHKLFFVDDRKRAFRLTYYPSKNFGLDAGYSSNHAWRSFYHMTQYKDFSHSKDISIDYALAQARDAQKVAESVLEAYRYIGITKDTLTSPINAFIKSNLYPPILTVDDIPEEAGAFAHQCVRGNWVESYKLGTLDAFDFDISGAYGYFLSELPDLRRGQWVCTPDYEPDAAYGFAVGHLTIDAPFHPFLVGDGEMQYTPVGTWDTYITKQEWDFIRDYDLGDFDCIDAWWWLPEGQQYQPFKGIVTRLWNLRQNAEPIADKILKRVLVGLWGVLGQTLGTGDNQRFGDRFNPVYHATVEANCRLAVARAVLDNSLYPEHLANIAVDGVVCAKPIPTDANGKLGGWRLSHRGKALVVSSGIVGIEGKDSTEDFAVTYERLISLITANPRARTYKLSKVSPVTLAKALIGDRWEDLGKLETITRTISIKEESKRMYSKVPRCGQDLLDNVYDSEPWDISIVKPPALLA